MTYTDGTHLVADTLHELHEFAKKIGLRREKYLTTPHPQYELTGPVLEIALKSGCERITPNELLKHGRGLVISPHLKDVPAQYKKGSKWYNCWVTGELTDKYLVKTSNGNSYEVPKKNVRMI